MDEAVSTTLKYETGRVNQFLRNSDGTVAAMTEAVYDIHQRRVSMRSRFLVEDDGLDAEDSLTDWVASVVDRNLLLVEREGEFPQWLAVEAPWPSASPLLMLYWLRGITEVSSQRASATEPVGTVAHVTLSVSAAVEACSVADAPGVQASFDEAELHAGGSVPAEVLISGEQTVQAVSLLLPGADSELSVEVEFSDLGKKPAITIPESGKPLSVEEFVNEVVVDEPTEN